MVLKRSLLFLLSFVVASFIGLSLLQSFNQPQVQDRLTLAQTYLTLQASEFQGEGATALNQALLGEKPYETALSQYRPLLKSAKENLAKTNAQLDAIPRQTSVQNPNRLDRSQGSDPQFNALQTAQQKQRSFLQDLELEAGILSALAQKPAQAQTYWQDIQQQSSETASTATAEILAGLWNDPPRLLPDAEATLKQNLRGWFRDEALVRLYTLEQRQPELETLGIQRQVLAQQTLTKLAIVVGVPLVSLIVGIGVLIAGLIQTVRHRLQAVEQPIWQVPTWEVPWDGSVLLIGVLGGFFLIGQLVISSAFGVLISSGISQIGAQFPTVSPIRFQALGVFSIYSLMATGVLSFLYLLLRRFQPLPQDWFRFRQGRWIFWGVCGYFVANPLVRLVSVINQQIWEGQGGSNPLLTLALENQDNMALLLFFVTAAIAAPIFEEIFFRGFLMASLTRFMPSWGAILLSGLIFAAAHLSLSEVLPLMTLGVVLGFVYGRSRNLLASILLHSLWNSSTLASLFLLGSTLQGS